MPYILPTDRAKFDYPLDRLQPETAGELNYCITRLLSNYMDVKGMRYQYMNDVVGALEGAKAEFQRVVVAPYEEKKMAENGDVYDVPPTHIIDIETSYNGIVMQEIATGKTTLYPFGNNIDNGNHDETRD
jgi:hypothetical protein